MDTTDLSSQENRKAATTAGQKYLSAYFLMGSDYWRYGYLIEDLENSFAKFNNEWPKTLNRSYALLMNWKNDQSFTSSTLQDSGGNIINHHIRSEDSDTKLQTTTRGGGKTGGSGSQVRRRQLPDSNRCY